MEGSVSGATSLCFLFVYEISWGAAEWICAKFTRKTCLIPCSDEFEGQGHQEQKGHFLALSDACVRFMFGETFLASGLKFNFG